MEKTTDFYEIYDYYYQPIWATSSFKIAAIILCLIVLGLTIYFVARHFLLKKRIAMLAPWQWAFEKLQKLSPKNYSTKNDFKKFYFDLTNIIKTYLNKRYDWKTLDKTENELIPYLEEKEFDKALLANLKKLIDGALGIKFANEDALKVQAENDLKLAYEIVEKTRETLQTSSNQHAKLKN